MVYPTPLVLVEIGDVLQQASIQPFVGAVSLVLKEPDEVVCTQCTTAGHNVKLDGQSARRDSLGHERAHDATHGLTSCSPLSLGYRALPPLQGRAVGLTVIVADSHQRLEDSKVDLATGSLGLKELLQLLLLAGIQRHPEVPERAQELWPSYQHAASLSSRWWPDSEDPSHAHILSTHPTSEVFENVEQLVTWIVKPSIRRALREQPSEVRVGYPSRVGLVHHLVGLLNVALG